MEIEDSYTRSIEEELAALLALKARIQAQPFLDQIRSHIIEIAGLPRLLESLDNPQQGRIFADKALRKSLLLREKIHQLLKKHGAGLETAR